ncbi:proteasome assembly chaperone family protein [Halomarina ordinaria]|uniref:Proteasome assembly chaperone family protein n=1 Tax=Halomarina ordinaria TaxID=3033939 RepID=A0ABD5U809_9EURY|nr:proteasome assembly chaperone family protein [Halomarina sp. PSRA2]
MAHIAVEPDISLSNPTLVEGLPGVGLVGKIAADHLVETLDMTYYGAVHCDGLPRVAVYHGDSSELKPPVRLYADEERDLLVLQSDVPVSPQNATDFASCITGWLTDNDVTPLFLSGLPTEKDDDVPAVYGIATGDGDALLDEAGIVPPVESGLVSGPTGALLYEAGRHELTGVGLIVEADAQFPDPEAARAILENGVKPLVDVEVNTEELVDQAEDIREARERLAQRMQQAEEGESTQAQPLRMFQ